MLQEEEEEIMRNLLSQMNESLLFAEYYSPGESALSGQVGSVQQVVPEWLWSIMQLYIQLIVVGGIIGNLVCIYFFLRNSELKRMSVTQYLLALAISDIFFLVSLAFTILQLHNVHWAAIPGMCDIMMYVTYLSTFLSGWYVMAVTVERAIVVRNPFHACRLQKQQSRRMIFYITTLGVFSNVWVTFMVEQKTETYYTIDSTGNVTVLVMSMCGESQSAHELIFQIFNWLDTVWSFTIPLFTSIILNTYIIIKLCFAAKRRAIMAPMRSSRSSHAPVQRGEQRQYFRASTADSASMAAHLLRGRAATDPLVCSNSGESNDAEMPSRSMTLGSATRNRIGSTSNGVANGSGRRFNRNSDRRSIWGKTAERSEWRVTFVLLTVSIGYLVLNLPSYTIRVWAATLPRNYVISPSSAVAEQFFYLLFYTQFAINFFFYSYHGVRSKWSGNRKSGRSFANFFCQRTASRELSREPVTPSTAIPPRSPTKKNGNDNNNLLQVVTSDV